MKTCSKCYEKKDDGDFYAGNSQCKACSNGRKRDRTKYMREYRRKQRHEHKKRLESEV
jgi:hypothetical protein